MKLFVTSLIVMVFLSVGSKAQPRMIDESAWMTFASEKAEFSLRMPKSSLVHVEDTQMFKRTSLYGFDRGVSVRFSQTKTSKARDWLRARGPKIDDVVVESEFKIEGIGVRTRITVDDFYRMTIVAASNSRYYVLTVSGANKDDPAIAYVLSSIRIKGTPIAKWNETTLNDQGAPVDVDSLKTSPEITNAIKAKRPKWNGKVTYARLAEYKKSDRIKTIREPVELTSVRPNFRPSLAQKGGVIRLRVRLNADGTVGDMTVFSDVERSILAAYADEVRELRFLPAIGSDGKAVDFTKDFVFTFDVSTFVVITNM